MPQLRASARRRAAPPCPRPDAPSRSADGTIASGGRDGDTAFAPRLRPRRRTSAGDSRAASAQRELDVARAPRLAVDSPRAQPPIARRPCSCVLVAGLGDDPHLHRVDVRRCKASAAERARAMHPRARTTIGAIRCARSNARALSSAACASSSVDADTPIVPRSARIVSSLARREARPRCRGSAARCRALARDATARSRSGARASGRRRAAGSVASRKRHREARHRSTNSVSPRGTSMPCTVCVGEARQQHEMPAIAKRPSHAHDARRRGSSNVPPSVDRAKQRHDAIAPDREAVAIERQPLGPGAALALGPVELAG